MRWKYVIQEIELAGPDGVSRSAEAEQELDGLGEDEWELVAVLPGAGASVRCFFKRPYEPPRDYGGPHP